MKKSLFFAGALLSIATAATAQTAPPLPAAVGVRQVRVSAAEMNPELDAARDADLLTGQLSLNAEQTASVRAAALTRWQSHRDQLVKHNAMTDHSHMQEENTAVETQYESQLKAILTPAQYERRLMIQARFRKIKEQAAAQEKAGQK